MRTGRNREHSVHARCGGSVGSPQRSIERQRSMLGLQSALVLLLLASPVAAQSSAPLPAATAATKAEPEEPAAAAIPQLTLSGFVSATLFAQDQSFGFGNGQSAVWAMPERVEVDNWFTGGDVRNTRLRLTLDQRVSERAAVQAVVETDFFGAFNGTGAFSDEQPQPRLRLAYVDLRTGRNTLRFGQMFTPLMGSVPVSLAHSAFPIGLASAGVIGWRHPGVMLTRQLVSGERTELAAQAGAFRGSWSGPGNNLDQQSAGEAASVPQLEARIDLRHTSAGGAKWSGYVVGHYDRKDLDGVGTDSAASRELEGLGVQAGGAVTFGRASVRGNAYWGRALGQQFAQLGQFGDIRGWGAWVQPGVRLSKHWDAFLFVGRDDPLDEDVLSELAAARRLDNKTTAALIRYTLGPYAIALEALRARTIWCDDSETGNARWEASARQISVSMLYNF